MNPELMTLIEAQAEALRADVDAIRAVLEIVEPAAFMAAFSQLNGMYVSSSAMTRPSAHFTLYP